MLLAVDVGNSNIVIGLFDGADLRGTWRRATMHDSTADELGFFINGILANENLSKADIDDVIIESVVPPLMYSMTGAVHRYLEKEPIIVGLGSNSGLEIKIDNPAELGMDNVVNAVAALELYRGNLIVVDFGTATTFSAITKGREYLGGAICPGLRVSIDALSARAAKLPWVELAMPDGIIGTNTIDCMQIGAVYGYAGQVDAIVGAMKRQLGEGTQAVATGGLSGLISDVAKTIDVVNKNLTIEGLRIIYDRGKNK